MFREMERSSKYYELYIEHREETERRLTRNLTKPWQKYFRLCPDCMDGMIKVEGWQQQIFRRWTVLIEFNFEALERLLDSRYHGQGTPEQRLPAYTFREPEYSE